jgi:phospholipid transport system substrate-binding protein
MPLTFTSTCFVVLTVLTGHSLSHAALTPTETVAGAVAAVRDILTDPGFKQPGMSDARREAIEEVVRDFVSYQDMARRSLEVTWTSLNQSEQHQYVGLFIRLLRDALACRIHDYSTARITYVSERRDGALAEVRTVFHGEKVDTFIHVRLVNRSGHWRMYDAIIDGVSLSENYRAQFGQVLRATSYNGLVRTIEANTVRPKTFESIVSP